ncbi:MULTISPECIES: hypothetical protein [unclassified Nostoc]|uniref:hypothetical protein n=1 Tax=unclassified Nostoc TaxID=2593658 RepID=UPI001D673F5F|nr:hypothetical protein [Nostoc sp. JL23]MBN3877772.1 hypothetical protein [Nostoc sp. JL23]
MNWSVRAASPRVATRLTGMGIWGNGSFGLTLGASVGLVRLASGGVGDVAWGYR